MLSDAGGVMFVAAVFVLLSLALTLGGFMTVAAFHLSPPTMLALGKFISTPRNCPRSHERVTFFTLLTSTI